MLWRSRLPGGREGRLGTWWSEEPGHGISFFEDIDLRGNELVVLGLMRAPHGMGPDGAVAWRTVLDDTKPTLHPVLYSLAGAGARPFQACGLFGIGHVRFFPDGRLLIVPGAEPGVFVLSSDNRPVKTWDTGALGVDVRCDFPDEKMYLFAGNEVERWNYLKQFSFVDAALPTDFGVLLFVKAAASNGTSRWTAILERDGEPPLSFALPWESKSPYDRLSADIQGDKLILLISDRVPRAPPRAGRLIEARLTVSGEKPVGAGDPAQLRDASPPECPTLKAEVRAEETIAGARSSSDPVAANSRPLRERLLRGRWMDRCRSTAGRDRPPVARDRGGLCRGGVNLRCPAPFR